MNVFRRLALSAIVSAAVGVPVAGQAQSCPTPPGKDVLLFVDNSSSITNAEFDEAQQAIASIAASVLSRPGYRLAVVNWGCEGGRRTTRDGCRVDLATGSAIPGGWSSNPADFAYAGNNSASNRVCRSFGTNFAGSVNRNNCGGANFSVNINDDYAQHGLKILEGVLYSGGTTGGNDSYNQPTLGPSAPTQQLMLIHMTDADPNFGRFDGTSIREMPSTETALGFYHYSNRFKNVRNAVIVGVGIDAASNVAVNRGELAAVASRGGIATDYDAAHPTALSTQAFDTGTPRIAANSITYNDATILSAANMAFNATVPACVILRKQSVGGTGSFSFTGGTNGLPSALTLSTATTNPQAATGVFLSQFNTPTSITETIPLGWSLTSAACVNASNTNVPVTSNLATGQLTIPAAQVVAGAQLTCTFTNRNVQPNFGTCDARMFLDSVTIQSTSVAYSTLYEFTFDNGSAGLDLLGVSANNMQRNALGFNPLDNYIYGISFRSTGGNDLYRIGSDGSSSLFGTVTGLPIDRYVNGAFSAAGDYYVYAADRPQMYRIAIGSPSIATPITLSRPTSMTDFAWYNGLLYGIENYNLVSIDPSTGVLTTVGPTQSDLESAAAMLATTNGLFGGLPGLYAIDHLTGAATLLTGDVPSPSGNGGGDGANCPTATVSFDADLSVTKTNTPASGPNDLPDDTYTPGEVRTYSILVSNSATSFGAQNITVSDPLPAGINASTVSWTCTSTSGDARCGATSGTGALNDTGLDLPPGAVAAYLVTLTVPTTFTGNLTNTVTITPPNTINDTNASNNTATDTDARAGSIVIIKNAVPNSAQDFAFTTTGTGLSSFSLDDDADDTLTNDRIFTGLAPGSYGVTETALAGWNLTGLTCVDPDSGSTVNPGTRSATIDLDAGETVTCTYTNTRETTPLPTGDRCPLLWGALRRTPLTGTGYGVLTSIDPATGELTYYPGAITDNDGGDITSLGIDPRTGRLFAVDNATGQIRTLAPGASTWSSTGVTAAGAASWHRMVMDAVGNLYLQGQDATQLYRYAVAMDGSLAAPATVTLTYSGAVPSAGGDLAIGPDGTIYIVAGNEQALYQLSGDLYAGTAATASQVATVPGDPGAAAFVGTTLYLGDSGNTLYAGPVTGPYMPVTKAFPRIGDMASCSAGLPPMLTLRKTWAGAAVNDTVTVSALDLTTGGATGAALDAVADTPSETDAGTAFAVVHGRSYTLSEAFTTGTADAYDKALTCTGNTGTGAALTYTANDMSGTLTVGDAATDIACTFTNVREPTLTLAKTWVNAATGDTATLTATGGTGSPALDSTAETANETDTGVAVKMAVGDVVTLAETLGGSNTGGYIAGAWNCTGGVLSGNTLTLTDADVGAAIICTIVNTLRQTDLQVVKTASPNPVVSGGVVTYQIVVTNNGPLAADGAVLTDVAGVGQDCTTPSTTATCSATGGATCPSPTVPVSSLLGSGITIPTLPVGGQVTIGLQCTVSATGTP